MEAVKSREKTGMELLQEAQDKLEKEFGARPTISLSFYRTPNKKTAWKIMHRINEQLKGEGVYFGDRDGTKWVSTESNQYSPKIQATSFYN